MRKSNKLTAMGVLAPGIASVGLGDADQHGDARGSGITVWPWADRRRADDGRRRINIPEDARRSKLTVTTKGARLCERAYPLGLEFEEVMMAPLTARQRALLWVAGGSGADMVDPSGEARPPRKMCGSKLRENGGEAQQA